MDKIEGNRYDNYVIVTHGLLMRILIMRYFRIKVEDIMKMKNPDNCEFWILNKEENG